MSSPLHFSCPHCKHFYEDGIELLDNEVQLACRCEKCGKPFTLLTKECLACVEETSFTWQAAPTAAQLTAIQCGKCHTPLFVDNGLDDED